MTKLYGWISVLCIGTLAATTAVAEGDRSHRADRARTFLVLRIAEALELSDAKALEISGIFKTAGEQRRAIAKERQAMRPSLEAAIDAGEASSIDELVAKAHAIDRRMLLVVSDSFAEVNKVLTPVQRGKLALLIPQVQEQLRSGGRRRGRERRQRLRGID